jgi:hypothetical protein
MLTLNQKYRFNHNSLKNLNQNRTTLNWLSDSYRVKAKKYGNGVGTLTRIFPDGHNGNLTMEDGQIFHVKSNYVVVAE